MIDGVPAPIRPDVRVHCGAGLGHQQLSGDRRPARREVVGETHRVVLLPAGALDEVAAEPFDFEQRRPRRLVGEEVMGEDQLIGGLANPVLLAGKQLARAEFAECGDHSFVGAYTFGCHGTSAWWLPGW